MTPNSIKQRLTYLRYLRKRYTKDPTFKNKILQINKVARKKSQAETLKRAMCRTAPWRWADMEQVENYCEGKIVSLAELAFVLGRTYEAVRKKMQLLGKRKTRNLKGQY